MTVLSKHTCHCPRLRSSPEDDTMSFFFPFPFAGPIVAPEVRTHENRSGTEGGCLPPIPVLTEITLAIAWLMFGIFREEI